MINELARLCEQVKSAGKSGIPLSIRGGNTRRFYGEPQGLDTRHTLDMRPYKGILNYQPTELVITARAGTPLSEIEDTVAQQGQMLAFEPPRFGPESTLGGCVASGLAGPRRVAAGGLSDFVLGARLLDSRGNLLSFGGEVMKNVAGYDVSRLLAGSLGSLGPIVEISIKVVPRPALEQTQCLSLDQAEALASLDLWRSLPLPISASSWVPPSEIESEAKLYIRLSGTEPAVMAGASKIGGQTLSPSIAAAFWNSLRDQTHPFFQQRPLWRLAVPPPTGILDYANTLIEWNGGLRWVAGESDAAHLRRMAAKHGGHATLYRFDHKDPDVPVFHPMPGPVERINRRMMEQLDPVGIFRPGRLLPALNG